jgi:sugar phosphate isomerase/epimerase
VKFKVGVTDWNLKQEAKIEALAMAKKLQFDGVQVSIGKGTDKLPLSDRALQQAYLAEAKRVGLPIASLCLEILHRNGLKSDPLGQRWVAESIPIAKALGVKVILLPFFGKWALQTQAEMDYVGDALREVAAAAEKAKIILGLEDTISAKDNVRIMERAKSPAVLTYYDVGNSTIHGFNVVEEIRWLGRERICEVHLKDNPNYLGKGKIDFKSVIDALADIGFDKWAQLETDSPSGSVENDMTVNLKFIRDLITARNKGHHH